MANAENGNGTGKSNSRVGFLPAEREREAVKRRVKIFHEFFEVENRHVATVNPCGQSRQANQARERRSRLPRCEGQRGPVIPGPSLLFRFLFLLISHQRDEKVDQEGEEAEESEVQFTHLPPTEESAGNSPVE